ncbi:alpha/beta-hydrolase [Wolfiporia cocos MD-104 SS10]|uniref:Alpha/beta-hydrolase n=1 Tax=Wolfiporia cocos (strain MD-104) TaxID=742152 RepID=A0A2H3J589_WOLCO|nr:alpha/beta-hydrolase [Wolfiporia cocos MD-104 SS10]
MFLSPTPTPVAIPHSPAPAHISDEPRAGARSSLDTLRTIHARGRSVHTSAPAPAPLRLPALSGSLPGSLRSWFGDGGSAQGSRESVHALLGDEDKQPTRQAEREHIKKKYCAPKNPVVFCHGLLGFDTVTLGPAIAPLQVTHWRGIKEAFEENGCEVLMTRVPATSSPVDRAQVLLEKISAVYAGRSVHLIGHSMGGLDCRYLTTHLLRGAPGRPAPFRVLSVTTISTPHRGSAFADHFLATVGRARMPRVLALLDLLPNGGGDGAAFEFLTVENMRRFNARTPDVEGVKYFSWGAVYEPGLIDTWKWPHSVIMEKEGPNDGLVSRASAEWGTYLGTLEGVNHLELIGWVNSARYKWAEIMGRELKFRPVTFYLGIADHLARVVEGQGGGGAGGAGGREGEGREARREREEREEIGREGERAEMAESLGKGAEADVPAREEGAANGDERGRR